MTKLAPHARHSNGFAQSLPLFDHADRRRWDNAPLAARMVRRRCRIESAAAATAIAELAGLRVEGDR
jgi:hypothetical protein